MTVPVQVRLFHPTRAAQRLAVVSVDRAGAKAMLQVARGKGRTALVDVRMFGPFEEEALAAAHAGVLAELRDEGYVAAGLGQLLLALEAKSPRVRSRAAQRLAWRREASAVEPLLRLCDKPKEDVATVIDALGALGDPRAIPAVRAEAEKKLLSRRRSGVEALRALGDQEGLAAARARARERLPEGVRAALSATTPSALSEALAAVTLKDRGLAIDTLYELDEPGCRAAALQALLLGDAFAQAHLWRYAKSVWKRALLRRDHDALGRLTHAFEVKSRAFAGTRDTLKSGYDGETRETRVFSRGTVDYLRRRAWRQLRLLARFAPDEYALAAAACLAPYVDGDDVLKGPVPPTGRSWLLHQILLGRSPRYELNARGMVFKMRPKAPAATGREERFPELWDRVPRAYVRVLGACRHTLAQRFAYDAVTRRAPQALQQATHAEVAALLGADEARIVDLGLQELRRRFDPAKPDLELVLELASSSKDLVRSYGLTWLNESARAWTRDLAWIERFLGAAHSEAREAAARLVLGALPALDPALRRELAARLLALVEQPETEEGMLAGFAEVLRSGLAALAADLCPTARALALVGAANDSAVSVGAAILAHKAGALELLGMPRVLQMTRHEKAAVRRAAMALLQGAVDDLRRDPSTLFGLLESDWDDVRAAALVLLDAVDLGALGLDGLVGLADSTRADVQAKARSILEAALTQDTSDALDVHELLGRLAQHPSAAMRSWVVDLALAHLKPGYVRLAKCELLFRAVLFDVKPDRRAKRRVLDFLAARGTQDENQAELAAGILGDFVRSRTRDEHERALSALAQVKLAFPTVGGPVRLVTSAGGAP